ncbi:haloacid dehalogenase type II [Methylobacterium sp. E-066]|uniref:haloacid dehalogenase type II n=1 Tax=Methylobacterium sp. E-066 TaxID=2836584 RepID=UPI001FBA7B9B|nr:haloacid dehalogenase type II [Methylobacterium sp. E-066]MCJ2139970.1 haloacid dehalogenase type II [Methylobacterium sp. E-066]
MLKLDPSPKVITFDCYGTLVQWHRAVREAAEAILSKHASGDDLEKWSAALSDGLRSAAVSHQDRPPFQDYKAILRLSLDEVLAEAGFQCTEDDHRTLLSILRRIEPHTEVPAALERLRERYKLAIISNTDDDLIAETVQAIGVPINFVITAQQARAYKPDHRLFQHAYDAMGVNKDETVHVGMGQVTDMKVCHERGIRSVWIDRVGETLDPRWQPHAVLSDLTDLPQLLSAP